MLKRAQIVSGALAFCLAALLFMIVPIMSAPTRPYDPWLDFNNDGKVGPYDLAQLIAHYGGQGDPITKASIEYDSGWIDITDKCGQHFDVTHNLNSMDIVVDLTGKRRTDGGPHQVHIGLTNCIPAWTKTYGGTKDDYASSLVHTSDGGYALAGYTNSFGAGGYDWWLVKMDLTGNIQWNKTYGGANDEDPKKVIQTSDGGYALAGVTTSFGAGYTDFWLVKTDANGNTQWNQTYGGYGYDYGFDVVQTTDGGYAITGVTFWFGAGAGDFWLVKTDAIGTMQWNQTYGAGGTDYAFSLIQTSEGGYAITGYTTSFGAEGEDFWLVKTDSAGNIQWNQTYGEIGSEEAKSVVQTIDGGYALVGHTNSSGAGGYDFWLVKTDSAGALQWSQTYGGGNNDYGNDILQTNDAGYAIVGSTSSFGSGEYDFWLVETDASGNMQWNKTYGGTSADSAGSFVQTSDGGYALAGYTGSYGAGLYDSYLVKTDSELGLCWASSTPNTITLYRGATDPDWNFVRVRIWKVKETP